MSFLSPKAPPPPPPVPPPPPAPPVNPIPAEGTRSAKERDRIRRKRGVSSTILTGPRGLLPEQMPVTAPTLLGGG
tara:strand:+ start:578 stop:802 length:225 start_codon:yes stop_codon:yes gene_type:complete